MGLVPPSIISLRQRSETQLKEEHPCKGEWDAMKEQAIEQGAQMLPGGNVHVPPDGGSTIASLPISKYTGFPYDPELIGTEYR